MDRFFSAIVLGLVQGLTEFLPISSTGHLILSEKLLQFEGPPGKIFEVVVQLGSACAVLVGYFRRISFCLRAGEGSKVLRQCILLATIPAGIAGFLFHTQIKALLYGPHTVATTLIAGGLFFLWLDRQGCAPRTTAVSELSLWQASSIGSAQAIALIPGVSRSGATIAAGVLVGMDRKSATEFSFLLSVPTLMGAGLYELLASWQLLSGEACLCLWLGFVTAFCASLAVFAPLTVCISRFGFTPFGWYRIALGLAVLLTWS